MFMRRGLVRLFFMFLFIAGAVVSWASVGVDVVLAADTPASGFVPCGGPPGSDDPATTDSDESSICTICHIIVMAKRVVDWAFKVITFFAIAIIVAMGILYIVSTGDEKLISTAKGGIKATLYGFALLLLAWLIVNVILYIAAKNLSELGAQTDSWFEFKCSTQSKAGSVSFQGSGGGGAPYGTPPVKSPGGKGTCEPQQSGACAVENMKACSSWNPEAASGVCMQESSGGNTLAQSFTDKCADGSSFSFGLFQINIIANGSMLGSDCSGTSVFSSASGGPLTNPGMNGGCLEHKKNSKGIGYCSKWNCAVRNAAKYNECKQRAFDVKKNIDVGCKLYNQSGWKPWPVTKKVCKL